MPGASLTQEEIDKLLNELATSNGQSDEESNLLHIKNIMACVYCGKIKYTKNEELHQLFDTHTCSNNETGHMFLDKYLLAYIKRTGYKLYTNNALPPIDRYTPSRFYLE